jgi:hypothetical protein
MFEVNVSAFVYAKAHERFGDERSSSGDPSEYDFLSGPLSAATIEFRHFDDLPEVLGPAIRSVTIVDPFFGVVAFIGVALSGNTVEIADFDDDPDYWSAVDPPLG